MVYTCIQSALVKTQMGNDLWVNYRLCIRDDSPPGIRWSIEILSVGWFYKDRPQDPITDYIVKCEIKNLHLLNDNEGYISPTSAWIKPKEKIIIIEI